jgi:glutamate dehydrogenase/leucine dehydrogenase
MAGGHFNRKTKVVEVNSYLPRLGTVRVAIHEILHAAHPRWNEVQVIEETAKIMNNLHERVLQYREKMKHDLFQAVSEERAAAPATLASIADIFFRSIIARHQMKQEESLFNRAKESIIGTAA